MKQEKRKAQGLLCFTIAFTLVLAFALIGMSNNSYAMSRSAEYKAIEGDYTKIVYNADYCPGSTMAEIPFDYDTVTVSDPSVVKALTSTPLEHDEDQSNPLEFDKTGLYRCVELIPMSEEGTSTVTITGTDLENKERTLTIDVVVEMSYYQAMLNTLNKNGLLGIYYTETDPGNLETEAKYNQGLKYGASSASAYARYGVNAKIKLSGKTTKSATCGMNNTAKVTGIKNPVKLGTKGTVTYTYGPAKITKTFKVVSGTAGNVRYVKAKSKKGTVKLKNIHKGDVVKIKIGKKTVRTYKVKKNASTKTITYKSKKKLKKGTKIKCYITNKYGQRLDYHSNKVGQASSREW